MNDLEFKITQLQTKLSSLCALFSEVGEEHWRHRMQTAFREIANEDFGGVERILSSYGGMGSLNDFVIHPLNGHSVKEEETDAVNQNFCPSLERFTRSLTRSKPSF